ncbi:MAG: hypothetical protein H6810_08105 [Phycisphaeraceae bacterium]|nr:MAG: hypothetical protein H6810_08105 [Phycisphaeraceae bacterium]
MSQQSVLAALACSLCLAPLGCRSHAPADRRARETVEPAQFVLAPGEPRRAVPDDHVAAALRAPAQISEFPAFPAPPVLRVEPGAPMSLAEAAPPVEQPVLLDAKVGDINGRPVFASEFLSPLEGNLRAKAREMGRDAWMQFAAGQIQTQLRSLITDELLRAEALSRLTVDQKAGLRRFLQDVRQNLISESGGSQQLAESRLRREQGLTEQEYLRQHEERTLVRYTIQEEISDRVNVSWRDIVRRYRRDDAKYHPQPSAKFEIMRVDAANEQAVAWVNDAIASGRPFSEIVDSEYNTWSTEGRVSVIPFTPPRDQYEFFGPPEINSPAQTLAEGETAGPIPFKDALLWLHLDSIVQDSISLYDAQLDIAAQLRSERVNESLQEYIDRLLGRASVTDVNAMIRRLVGIAADRYAPAAGPATGQP